jgi:hypothetical protein
MAERRPHRKRKMMFETIVPAIDDGGNEVVADCAGATAPKTLSVSYMFVEASLTK